MKEKFKRIKDKKTAIYLLAKQTGCSPTNIANNWFGNRFVGVPKNRIKETESFLDSFLTCEREVENYKTKLLQKHFNI